MVYGISALATGHVHVIAQACDIEDGLMSTRGKFSQRTKRPKFGFDAGDTYPLARFVQCERKLFDRAEFGRPAPSHGLEKR